MKLLDIDFLKLNFHFENQGNLLAKNPKNLDIVIQSTAYPNDPLKAFFDNLKFLVLPFLLSLPFLYILYFLTTVTIFNRCHMVCD